MVEILNLQLISRYNSTSAVNLSVDTDETGRFELRLRGLRFVLSHETSSCVCTLLAIALFQTPAVVYRVVLPLDVENLQAYSGMYARFKSGCKLADEGKNVSERIVLLHADFSLILPPKTSPSELLLEMCFMTVMAFSSRMGLK